MHMVAERGLGPRALVGGPCPGMMILRLANRHFRNNGYYHIILIKNNDTIMTVIMMLVMMMGGIH